MTEEPPPGADFVVEHAQDFAAREQARLESILTDSSAPRLAARVAVGTDGRSRVTVTTDDELGIPLFVSAKCVLRLIIVFECTISRASQFLAVERSTFKANVDGSTMPLFTVDYSRTPSATVPGAHINVHANRKDMVRALERGVEASREAAQAGHDGGSTPDAGHGALSDRWSSIPAMS